MKNEKLAIGFLSITAVLLLCACLFVNTTPRAKGEFSIKDRDFQVATMPMQRGGDALLITDNRTGQMVLFVYDARTKGLEIGARMNATDLFAR